MPHLSAGIVGLPNAGKTTLFNALTRAGAQVASFPFSTISPVAGMASVPDPRLTELSRLVNPQRTTPAAIEFVDIAGLVKGAHRGEGLGNEFLSRIRGVDVVVEVVRCFEEREIAHPEGSVDPIRDIEIIETELLLSDLEMAERRLTKLNKLVKSVTKEKLALLNKAKQLLEKGKSLRKSFSDKEKIELSKEGFLSSKPLLYIANIGEEDLTFPSPFLSSLRDYALGEGIELIEMCAQLEAELAELPPGQSEEFFEELEIKEPGINKVIKQTFRLLNLITFFTISGGKEVKAWPIPRGTTALQAAGKVHSDMEKGFICAEVIPVSSLLEIGSIKRAKEEGKMRTEGKEYVVEDGDVIHFKFRPS